VTYWVRSADGDSMGYAIYRRHYSARNRHPKRRRFVGPGQRIVLVGWFCSALFVWRKAKYRADGQTGVECAVFRNESHHRSSDMIRDAMEIAWEKWPDERLFTMVDPKRVRGTNPGYCFKMAGWKSCGHTLKGLRILEYNPTRLTSAPLLRLTGRDGTGTPAASFSST
jgi:hypothetical protein